MLFLSKMMYITSITANYLTTSKASRHQQMNQIATPILLSEHEIQKSKAATSIAGINSIWLISSVLKVI
jgi:hypothetical protein